MQLFGSKANVLLLDANGTIIETFLKKFGDRMPKEIWDELKLLREKLSKYQ